MSDTGTSTKPTNKERIKEIVAGIEDGIQELFQSEKYFDYLRTMSRFHSYSVNNTILIHLQMPNATAVAGFNQWKNRFGRNVKKGEKGLTIIAPTPFKKRIEEQKLDPDTNAPVLDADGNIVIEEKVIEIPMFKPVKVFDVSQTEGKPLPQLSADLTGDVQQFEAFMEALRRASPVPIEMQNISPNMDGYFSLDEQKIVVRTGMSQVQTVCATVHEIGHSMLHNREQTALTAAAGTDQDAPKPKDKNTREVEAESVSYAVCQYYGIETGSNSFGYIATWSKDKTLPELRASLETITKTANVLITGIDKHFAEVCKERGIALAERQEQEETQAQANLPKEALFKLDGKYLHIFQTEGVFAYQIYDANSKKGLGGGWIEAPGAKSMREVGEAIAVKRDLDTRRMELASHNMIAELRQANTKQPDTPEKFAADFCAYLDQLYHEGVIENPFTVQSAEEFAPEIADLLRHGHFNGTRDTLTEASKRAEAPAAAAALLRRLDDLTDQWEATLVYGMNQHPFSSGEHDRCYIQEYEKTEKGLAPREVIYVGSEADCLDLTRKLNERRITAREVRAMERQEAPAAKQQQETVAEAPPEPVTAEKQPDTALDEYPMPDASMREDVLEAAGYTDTDLLPLSPDRAGEMLDQNITVYMVQSGEDAAMVFDRDELRQQTDGAVFAVPRDEWEASPEFQNAVNSRMDRQEEREAAFLNHSGDCFAIYQLKHDDDLRHIRYESLETLRKEGESPMKGNYELVYTAPLPEGATLPALWDKFNTDHPADYRHPSMSVSDIVAIKQDGVVSCNYVDRYAFTHLPGFLEKDNYLKNAELAMEDDANMIDGIINNGPKQPTVAEFEASVKAGGQISLTDLAAATHREERAPDKRPSVLARLNTPLPKQQKDQKTAPKRSAERDR